MPQILNKYSFGADLGASIGSGLGQGLQYLAQNKINQMTRANEMSQYSNLLQTSGLDPRDADVLAYHAVNNPQHFHQILEQYSPRQAINQQATEVPQYQQGLQQLEQQQPVQQQTYRQPTPEQAMQLQQLFKGLGQPQQEPSGLGEGADLLRKSAANELLKTAVGKQPQEEIPQLRQAQQQLQQQVPQIAKQPPLLQEQPKVTQRQLEEQLHPLLAKKKATEEALANKERREDEKIAREETKEYFEDVNKRGKAAENNKLRATKILHSVKEGKLPNAALWNFLTHVEESSATPLAVAGGLIGGALGTAAGSVAAPGVGTIAGGLGGRGIGAAIGSTIGALGSSLAGLTKTLIKSGNPDIEEIEQLSSQFVLDAKQYFGSRLTDADLKAFMNTTVKLGDTPAGMERKLNNMIEVFDLEAEERNIAKDIIRKNDNKRPINLQDQVDDRMEPKRDAAYKKIFAKK